jgi:uncharacterized protein
LSPLHLTLPGTILLYDVSAQREVSFCEKKPFFSRTLAVIRSVEPGPGQAIKRCRRRWKFMLQALRHRQVYEGWFRQLETAAVAPYLALNPALPMKPLRAYLGRDIQPADRIRIITDSLAYIDTHPELQNLKSLGPGLTLVKVNVENHGEVTLNLQFNNQEEGELSLALHRAGGRRLGISSFSLEKQADGSHALRIGRIQGSADAETLGKLEKALHGMRMNAFLLFATQEWAHVQGITRILGVTDHNQTCRAKQIINVSWVRRIGFSYDSFWAEMEGRRENSGWYLLPPRLIQRSTDEMKRNKRSMYKKRYALLDSITAQIQQQNPDAVNRVQGIPPARAVRASTAPSRQEQHASV